MEDIREGFALNDQVQLHHMATGTDPELTPVLIAPGVSDRAESFLDLMRALAPRRCASFSFRGRGLSDAPVTGYSLEHHVSDLEAVAGAAGLEEFVLFAHSRAVPYALAFTARHPERLAGLVLADYPAVHTELEPDWTAQLLTSHWRGEPVSLGVKRAVISAIQRESERVDLWDGCAAVACPTLVVRGGGDGAVLSPDDADRYLELLPRGECAVIQHAGHDLWAPDAEAFTAVIRSFLERLDAGTG